MSKRTDWKIGQLLLLLTIVNSCTEETWEASGSFTTSEITCFLEAGTSVKAVLGTYRQYSGQVGYMNYQFASIREEENEYPLIPYHHFGLHTADVIVEPEKTYHIVIPDCSGYSWVAAETTVPALVPCTVMGYVQNVNKDTNKPELSCISIAFQDPLNSDYYELQLEPLYHQNTPVLIQFDSVMTAANNQNSVHNPNLIFTDKTFDGLKKTLNIYFNPVDTSLKYVLQFKHVSGSYFKYKQALNTFYKPDGTLEDWHTSEKRNTMYTNIHWDKSSEIENPFITKDDFPHGIFASFTSSSDTLDLSKNFNK